MNNHVPDLLSLSENEKEYWVHKILDVDLRIKTHYSELYRLARISQPGYCLEIGTDTGISACLMALASAQTHQPGVYSIDSDIGEGMIRYPHRKNQGGNRWHVLGTNILLCGLQEQIVLIVDDSLRAYRWFSVPIRLLLIDGNHDYQHASQDIANYGKWLVSGGYIVCHDYNEDGVARAVQEQIVPYYSDIIYHKDCHPSYIVARKP